MWHVWVFYDVVGVLRWYFYRQFWCEHIISHKNSNTHHNNMILDEYTNFCLMFVMWVIFLLACQNFSFRKSKRICHILLINKKKSKGMYIQRRYVAKCVELLSWNYNPEVRYLAVTQRWCRMFDRCWRRWS